MTTFIAFYAPVTTGEIKIKVVNAETEADGCKHIQSQQEENAPCRLIPLADFSAIVDEATRNVEQVDLANLVECYPMAASEDEFAFAFAAEDAPNDEDFSGGNSPIACFVADTGSMTNYYARDLFGPVGFRSAMASLEEVYKADRKGGVDEPIRESVNEFQLFIYPGDKGGTYTLALARRSQEREDVIHQREGVPSTEILQAYKELQARVVAEVIEEIA